jgi:hypothetical protein
LDRWRPPDLNFRTRGRSSRQRTCSLGGENRQPLYNKFFTVKCQPLFHRSCSYSTPSRQTGRAAVALVIADSRSRPRERCPGVFCEDLDDDPLTLVSVHTFGNRFRLDLRALSNLMILDKGNVPRFPRSVHLPEVINSFFAYAAFR